MKFIAVPSFVYRLSHINIYIYNYNIICVPLFFNVVYKQVHCCHNSVLVFSLLSYTNMHIEVLMCIVCQQRWESVIYKVLLYQVSCVSVFPLVSYINVHIPICSLLWCEKVLFTNNQCHIIKPYLFHASKHSGKRVTQTCMSYLLKLFFVDSHQLRFVNSTRRRRKRRRRR